MANFWTLPDGSSCLQNNNVLTFSCVTPLIQGAIRIALALVGITTIFFIIMAGITYITSGGGKQVEQAKNMITYAIIGLIVVLLSSFIINLVAGVAGFDCIMLGNCYN